MGSAPRPIQAGELVPLLSPSRRPPGYNRVFQSEGEIQRQVRALRNWAKSDGLFLSPADEQSIRGRAEASGGGEEHNVLLFRQEGESFVIKGTRRESGFPGMAPAQYFARWGSRKTLAGPCCRAGRSVGSCYLGETGFHRWRSLSGSQRVGSGPGGQRMGEARAAAIYPQGNGRCHRRCEASNVIKGLDGEPWPFDVIVESTGSL